MAGFWVDLPPAGVVRLVGASPKAIGSALEPVTGGAPAVVHCRLSAATSPAGTVATVLDRLDEAARDLYPAWLPGAEPIVAGGGAAIAAVRALARQRADSTPHFGPFLADLAARSLSGGPPPGRFERSQPDRSQRFRQRRFRPQRFRPEVRAAGLARVLADSYRRSPLALLVEPPDPGGRAADVVITACEWLAHHGGFPVWLAGTTARPHDRLPTVTVSLAQDPPDRNGSTPDPPPTATLVRLPAVAGAPHPASRSERALEAALAKLPWATGRVWNRTFQPDPLTNPIRVDLMWPDERCAVEIDGEEHRGKRHYEDDRRRDTVLQFAGFAVLRYTNTRVARDLAAVLAELEGFITNRRLGKDSHGT